MRSLKYAYLFVAVLMSAAITSCSSDDVIDTNVEETSRLSFSVSTDLNNQNSSTRAYLHQDGGDLVQYWQKDDHLLFYSPAKKYYNSLVLFRGVDTSFGAFESESNLDTQFHGGETGAMLYCGEKNYMEELRGGASDLGLTLSRENVEDNKLAIFYGNGEEHFVDNGNPFIFKACSAVAKTIYGPAQSFTLVSRVPKIRLEFPAIDKEQAEELAKLDYTITVDLKDAEGDNTGFPQKMNLQLDVADGNVTSNVIKYDEAKGGLEWGKELTVKFKGGDTSKDIWFYNGETDEMGLKGYVYIPFPAWDYSLFTVTVDIEKPEGVSVSQEIEELCGQFKYESTDAGRNNVGKDLSNTAKVNYVYFLRPVFPTAN